jgi:hypothetical protein
MPIDYNKLSDAQLKVAKMVSDEAKAQGLDPDLVLPLAYQESRFREKALGPMTKRGEKAVGVMQLLPSTAKSLKVDPHKLEENIRGGVTYFKQMLENPEIGGIDKDRAYIAYNAGPNSQFFKTGNPEHIPTESILYLKKIRAHGAEEESPETQAMTSESAPPESMDQNEEFVNDTAQEAPAEAPAAEAAAAEPPGQFNFDFEKFKKEQEAAAQNKPYEFSDQSLLTGAAGAGAGLTVGTGQVGLKALNDFRNLPKDLTTAVQAAKTGVSASGSPQGVRDWALSQGYKDRGAQTYKKADQAESGRRTGSKIRNPLTGEVREPVFRAPKPPAFEPVVEPPPSALKQAGNWGSKLLQHPLVNRTLGGLGIAFSGNEAYERAKAGDVPGTVLAGTSALASAASLYPPAALPANLISAGSTGSLAMLDKIRNKMAEEAKTPQAPVTEAELKQANQPVGGFYPQRMAKRRSPEQLRQTQQQLTGKLLGDLDNQLQDFSKPAQSPLAAAPK